MGIPNGMARPGRSAAVADARSTPVTVSVIADDMLSGVGVTAYLEELSRLTLLPPERRAEADVVVVVASEVTESLLTRLADIHGCAVGPDRCVVLVSDVVPKRFMARMLASGVVSVLPRIESTPAAVARVVLASAAGRSVLSPWVTRMLIEHCREFEYVVRTEHGIVSGGLTTREVDVVRLLAEGMSTAEIATRIPYSERTIKNIIQELLERMNFRNRMEAVAYAFRVGAL
jgi:DNA-binding NarL/FixJ family response regulator